jgi:hypothetical protein
MRSVRANFDSDIERRFDCSTSRFGRLRSAIGNREQRPTVLARNVEPKAGAAAVPNGRDLTEADVSKRRHLIHPFISEPDDTIRIMKPASAPIPRSPLF